MTRCSLFLVAVCVTVGFVGCGGPADFEGLQPVKGKVTLDGQPVTDGFVQFWPADKTQPTSYAQINSDGTYELTAGEGQMGAVAGQHKVTVNGPEENSFDDAPQPDVAVPEIYSMVDTTPITVEVQGGENNIDLELSSSADGGGQAAQ